MTDITVRFKNDKINFTKTRKSIEYFKAIYSQFNTRTLIASDSYKKSGHCVDTRDDTTKICGKDDYLVFGIEAYDFDFKNNILKAVFKVPGEYTYTSYYKLN